MSDATEDCTKFKGKVTCAFKNEMRDLPNMHGLK